ncbi:sigma-E factor negative regulatory protein [Chitinilyticum piscinae]|uniref:Sigma-E factor negative regulatory protein n=1 Tax=Chitinilyticum piscinae TaxID=2866724 RepID=A0A8J7KEW1_9NEIS|nr:sigma-E factor negative regulatory protein [Chitinilyticum piscinae]MBE9609819.1 sigma-E factor negative regulatory protein [Chitinilyticum piscinae]
MTKMTNQATTNERLSALMDGELDNAQAQAVISELLQSGEMQTAWYEWHMQQDSQHGHPLLSPDFMAAFTSRLHAEPVVVAPQRLRRARPVRRLLVPLTAAASVAFIGVALWQGLYRPLTPAPAPLAVVSEPVVTAQVDPEAVRAYLSAHREAANSPLSAAEPMQLAFQPEAAH